MNKRVLKRNILLKPIKVFSKFDHQHIGNIVDIHTEGMKIISKHHFNDNEYIHLLIDLPDNDLPIHEIELTGKNIWTKDFLVNRYFTGVKFENISTETKMDLIDNVIHKYGFAA